MTEDLSIESFLAAGAIAVLLSLVLALSAFLAMLLAGWSP